MIHIYTLVRAEQETIIRWDAENRTASIDTADPVTLRKLDKLVEEFPETYRCIRVDPQYTAKRYEVDSRYIKFGKPATEKRREIGRRAASFLRRETTVRSEVSAPPPSK